jgi:hypothetical protein
VLAPHAAKVGVVADEVGKLPSLLNEVAACESVHLVLETRDAEELGQHVA